MDKFSDLEAFVAVVEMASFSAASERLEVAKSAVSRRVSQLENRLGASLLNRTTRRLSLTDSGKVFYEQARQILTDLSDAEQQVSDQQGELKGIIRIAAPLSFGYLHLADVICEFLTLNPEIELDVDLNDRMINLVEDGFDMAIRIGELVDSNLVARRIAEIPILTIASPDYLKKNGTPKTPMDLENHVGLEYTNLPRQTRWRFKSPEGKDITPNVPCRFRANNGNVLLTMAVNGLGVLRTPTFMADTVLQKGKVVKILEEWDMKPQAMHAVYPPGRHLSRRVRAFTDFLVLHFRDRNDWTVSCEKKD